MNGLTYKCVSDNPALTKQLAASLATYLRPGDVVAFSGDLGAGKTQFVQGVAEALGVNAQVTSPTFNVLLEYHDGRLPLYHFDLYRLDHPSELEDVGFYDVIDADGVTFVEWADRFPDEMPYDYLSIDITSDETGRRTVRVHSFGSRSRSLLHVWAHDPAARLRKA